MYKAPVTRLFESSALLFPPQYVQAALVLALMNVWMVIALFVYLDQHTKKPYFKLWTASWMFFSVYLAASIGLVEIPDTSYLAMARRACIGISALFMFWGSFQLTNQRRTLWELGSAVLLLLIWSYVGVYRVGDRLWITVPVFLLLASSGIYTGVSYMRRRKRSHGARILGIGFLLWGGHLAVFPYLETSPVLAATGYVASALLALFITVGMVVEHQVTVSEQNYRTLFDSASDAMFLVEYETLRILEANPAARRMSGRMGEQLDGHGLLDLFPELREETGRAHGGPATAPAECSPRRELRRQRPDGQFLVYEASANLFFSPHGAVLLIVARDITERKQAEEALKESNQRLEAALAELKATQQQVVQQERLSALSKMASGVAHDFNNALAKILGFNELLLAWPDNLLNQDKVKKYLQMSNTAAWDAVKIVNRLREFYRHREDSEVYQPVDINQLIEQAIILTQPKWKDQAMASGVTVWLETELRDVPPVHGCNVDLREVLINLILNAAEAMPQGGTLRVETVADHEQVVVRVCDTGTGMTEEVRRRCLEPFFSTKGDHGTGLGLAIVYGIVQRHGGSIDIESELGRGTTFVVRFPIRQEQPTNRAVTETTPLRSLRILMVEDEPTIRDIQAEYLRGDGHVVETAANGLEGLEKIRAAPFDLVVADRAMPEMNGDDMVEAIKAVTPGVPVIMVTGFSDLPGDNRNPAAKPNLILAKPITQPALRQAVEKIMAESLFVAPAS